MSYATESVKANVENNFFVRLHPRNLLDLSTGWTVESSVSAITTYKKTVSISYPITNISRVLARTDELTYYSTKRDSLAEFTSGGGFQFYYDRENTTLYISTLGSTPSTDYDSAAYEGDLLLCTKHIGWYYTPTSAITQTVRNRYSGSRKM